MSYEPQIIEGKGISPEKFIWVRANVYTCTILGGALPTGWAKPDSPTY